MTSLFIYGIDALNRLKTPISMMLTIVVAIAYNMEICSERLPTILGFFNKPRRLQGIDSVVSSGTDTFENSAVELDCSNDGDTSFIVNQIAAKN